MRNSGGVGRAGLTVGAQSVASLTNFVAIALAQSVSSLEEFGRVFIVFQLCQIVVALAVGSVGSAILTHTSGDPHAPEVQELRTGGAATAAGVGIAAGALLAIAAVVASDDLRAGLVIAALGSPGLVAQYVLRATYFGRNDPAAVLRIDLLWLAVVLGVAVIDQATGWEASALTYLGAWVAGATVSGAPLLWAALRARRPQIDAFLGTTGRQAFMTGLDGLMARTVFVVLLFSTRTIVDDAAVGALSAALLPFTPMSVVHTSAFSVAVPATLRRGGIRVIGPRIPLQVSSLVVLVTVLWMAGILVLNTLPFDVGPFDISREGVTTAIVAATFVRFLALGARSGPAIGLRVADAAADQLASRAIGTVAQWVLPVIGLLIAGTAGGAWGLAVGTLIGLAETWRRFLRLGRRARTVDR